MKTTRISGWGLYPQITAQIERPAYLDELVARARSPNPLLGQGNRRSYGDACLAPNVVSALGLRHLLAFDPGNGLLRAEAGITLEEIIRFALPRGFFLPVTPGTKHTTLGGCIAADVHGKNHHLDGSIGNFVAGLEIVLAGGRFVYCSRTVDADLFHATLGGMGLTGFIYTVSLHLKKVDSAYITQRTIRTAHLRETCQIFADTHTDHLYSVAWIDCQASGLSRGRSIVLLGDHLEDPQRGRSLHRPQRLNIPCHFPSWVLNTYTIKLFNTLYYRRQWQRQRDTVVHYDPFFYPLDVVGCWNRLYGRPGFLQYQCVVPFRDGIEVMDQLIERVATRGWGSFLAVLKTFGPQDGLLSFPMPGYTLSLDFPLRHHGLVDFLRTLNKVVLQAGGRIYLAKDAVLEREDFLAMYPKVNAFKRIKAVYDPQSLFRSLQSDRLGLT